MQIINCQQGSEEWLKARLGIPSASNFSKIVTSTGKLSESLRKYAEELVSDMLIIEPEEGYKNADMLRGNELEPEAAQAYQEYTFNTVEECGFMIKDGAGYSPDRMVDENGLIEIKCPNKVTHTKYLLDKKLPIKYLQQCQGGLMVSNRKWLDFISFHPNFKGDNKLFIIRVFRNEEFIKKLVIGIKRVIEIRNELLEKIREKNG